MHIKVILCIGVENQTYFIKINSSTFKINYAVPQQILDNCESKVSGCLWDIFNFPLLEIFSLIMGISAK